MTKLNLNAAVISALPKLEQGQSIFWDAKLKGFGVRLTKSAASYICEARVKGRTRRVTVAPVGTLTVAEARKEAQKQLGQMATDVDPNKVKAEARAKGITFGEAKTKFLNKTKLSENSRYDYGRVFAAYFSDWEKRELQSITPQMFAKRFTKLQKDSGQATANKALRVFRSMWNYTRTVNLVDGMPILPECPIFIVMAEGAYEEVERRNTTVHEALPQWFAALADLDAPRIRDADRAAGRRFRDYAELCLRTGLRASEAASMRCEDVDFADNTFTVRNTKNGTDHTLPIVPQIAEILERSIAGRTTGYVFPAKTKTGHLGQPQKLLVRTRETMGQHWSMHDLRRSFATIATMLKIDGYTLKTLLNHSRKNNDVTLGYVNLSADDLRHDMQRINDKIDKVAKAD
ncbi:tyrosine-type recombinase/integrase [Shimia thalassica]|uniref:tyrosine-type recombinase/integrase n=1 Tax=Shimia thalassica TaxID=1715693 RepID=UPI0026E26863|nr:tyrosine-type recombinase/integrase [Shimia thalassica]MDO6800644.1 tyrosine-type recombinase/integrase [Shimia thalassica]